MTRPERPPADASALSKSALAIMMIFQRNAQHGIGFEGLQEPSADFLKAFAELSPAFMRHDSDASREYFSLTPVAISTDCEALLGGIDRREFLMEHAQFSLYASQPEVIPDEGVEP